MSRIVRGDTCIGSRWGWRGTAAGTASSRGVPKDRSAGGTERLRGCTLTIDDGIDGECGCWWRTNKGYLNTGERTGTNK